MYITSAANPKIKHIRKLSDRKHRTKYQQFLCEGLRIVGQALERDIGVEMLLVAPELLISEYGKKLVSSEKTKGTNIIEISAELFSRLSSRDGPRGIALVGRQRWAELGKIQFSGDDIWIALDSIQDPGNLGTILRTADGCGCEGVILLDNCADAYDPAAIRASMGAVFTQKLVKTSFQDFSNWVKSVEVSLIASSGASKTDFRAISYQPPVVLLMGSEREGLKQHHIVLSHSVVSIPMSGRVDSLNVAVAAGIILYEICYQQAGKVSGGKS